MKKFLALILSLVCVFALAFTACGEQPGDNTDEPNNEQTGDNEGNENNDQTGNENNDQQGNEEHTHIYESAWSYDSLTHWHKATCHPEEIKDEAPHSYVNGKCSACNRPERYEVGDILPDFVIDTLAGGTFSSESARGKVLVINFWYVNCGPCIAEIPEMEKIVSEKYSDDVVMIALHSSGSEHASDLRAAPTFIAQQGWSNYGMIFGKDNGSEDLYKVCGGDGNYPLTVILNSEGIITFIQTGWLIYFDIITMTDVDYFTPAIEAALGN